MKHSNKILQIWILAIALLAIGQSVWAQDKFTVTNSTSGQTTTFTITRNTGTDVSETVMYRTVGLSAIAGKHFTDKSGNLVFDADNNTRTVQVQENPIDNLDPEYKYQYQTSTRSYALEVLDATGFKVASSTRNIFFGTGYNYQEGKVSNRINDLVKFNSGSSAFATSMSSSKYIDVSYSMSSNSNHVTSGGYFKIDDEYYYGNQTLCNVSTAELINSTGVSREYLSLAGAKIYATVCFTMKEEDDGYQYIQILTDNTTNWDCYNKATGETAGQLKDPSISIYKALFELSKTTPKKVTDDHNMFFPHKSNDTYNASEFEYSDAWMYSQKFKNSANRATNSGSLVLEPKVKTINVRFDASGEDNDTWWVKNLFVRMALCDDVAPTITSTNDITLSAGPYNRGNTFYISVPFSEIVKISGNPTKLSTTWGDAYYESGRGTNVLTFKGTINANAGTVLEITGKSGTITDIAGNEFSGSLNKTFNGVTCASPTYTITYDLNGSNEAVANPTTYTYETATFTLTNPTWTGYVFTGWTGSNGTTPQTTVTVNTHSHGDLTYTANWTDVWGMSSGADGSQAHPYTITTPEGLVYLSDMVNSTTHGYSGTYFQLGADIDMKGCDFTPIGITIYNATTYTNHFFYGVFNGQGHIIRNLGISITQPYAGLFGYLNGVVNNVIVDWAEISGNNFVGAIAGRLGSGSTTGKVKNCHVFNSTVTGGGNIGVIVGYPGSTTNNVSNSYYRNCTVNGADSSNLFTITVTGNATASGTPNITYNSVDYYTSGQTVTLGYSGISEGYTITYTAKDADDNDITSSAIIGNVLTMPESDVTISATATRNPISTTYIDADGNSQTVTAQPLEGGETELGVDGQETWYVVDSNISYDHEVELKGNVHLILSDGYTMTMTETDKNNQCIWGNENNLTIYGQSGGSGALNATSSNCGAISAGILTINGGHITVTAKYDALSASNSVIINSGIVEATSTYQVALLASNNETCSITINGGVVKANGQNSGFVAYDVIINGGKVETNRISCTGLIVLGYSNSDDYIKCGDYSVYEIRIADGLTMTGGTNTYSGWLTSEQIAALAGKTLRPYTPPTTVSVDYIDADGSTKNATATTLSGIETELGVDGQETWYVVNSDIGYDHQVTLAGNTHLILGDGKTMVMSNTYIHSTKYNLTIYGQGGGTGTLTATNNEGSCVAVKTLTVNGGQISATAKYEALVSKSGITINGGTVTVACTETESGISTYGLVSINNPSSIVINGGTVTATNCTYGFASRGGTVTINGGTVAATNCTYGFIVERQNSSIAINNGTVSATNCTYGFAMEGNNASNTSIKINGGSVTTTNTDVGMLLNNTASSSSSSGQASSIIINGGKVETTAIKNKSLNMICLIVVLGYSNSDDYIKCGDYSAVYEIRIADGQTMTDGTNTYSGTLNSDQRAAIVGKTLRPYTPPTTVSVDYIDASGNTQNATATTLSGIETELGNSVQETWYVVNSDVYYDHQVQLKGIVHLILSDGHTMTMTETDAYNIYGNRKNLTIYGQSGGTGALIATSENGSAIDADILTINGGHITATAKNSALSSGTSITINGGVVEATSSSGYPINVSFNQTSTSITINGGSVKALSPADKGLYTYSRSESSIIIINGGQVEASKIKCFGGSNYIVLGYRNADDYIFNHGEYSADRIQVADGLTMTDGTNTYTGSLSPGQIAAISGKTLRPFVAESPNITLVQGEKGGVTCYWGTFYHSTLRYILPEGAAAYTMGADHRLYRLGADGRVIPAGVAVVIIAEKNSITQGKITLTKSDDSAVVAVNGGGNILLGNNAATAVTAGKVTVGGQQKIPYVLSAVGGNVDFYPLSSSFDGSIPHNKAYYVVDATQ